MRRKPKLFHLSIVLIVFTFVFLVWSEDYSRYIGQDWHPRFVKGDEISLLTGGDNYPCHVKAYGWKILSKRRDKLGVFGDLYIKWGWKIVVHNPEKDPIKIFIRVELKSHEDFVLDTSTVGKDSGSSSNVDYLLNRYARVEWIQPGRTEVLSGVSQYNASSHKGEGDPSYIDFRVKCE